MVPGVQKESLELVIWRKGTKGMFFPEVPSLHAAIREEQSYSRNCVLWDVPEPLGVPPILFPVTLLASDILGLFSHRALAIFQSSEDADHF